MISHYLSWVILANQIYGHYSKISPSFGLYLFCSSKDKILICGRADTRHGNVPHMSLSRSGPARGRLEAKRREWDKLKTPLACIWQDEGVCCDLALDLFEESKQVQAEADDLQRENKSDLLSVTAAVRMMLPPHLLMEIWQIELQKSQLIHFSVKLIFCLFFNIEHLCVLLLCSLHVFFTQIKRIIYRSESKRLW